MKWFTDVFLPSLEKRMNNPKYPNQCILTPKQANICYKYMDTKDCHGDYGWFSIYEITVGNKKYQVSKAGKYIFLNMYIV